MKPSLLFVLFAFLAISCTNNHQNNSNKVFVKGAYILNLQDKQGNFYDIPNGFLVFENNTILDFGAYTEETKIPENAKTIDAKGKFLIPGLIDGFAVLNNQFYANAFLAKGVTTIIGVDGGRRGWFYPNANPSPDFYRLESVGDEAKSDSAQLQDLRNLHHEGFKIALLKYQLKPNQVALLQKEAKKLGMGTIGELGHTSYAQATQIGVDAFVHTTRYSLDLAPKKMREAVADHPFSNEMNSPKWKYYQYLFSLDTANPILKQHATNLASGRSFIMPTLSLLYADLPQHKNPWNDPVSKIINPVDVNNPVDKKTGKHLYTPEVQANYTATGLQELKIENVYYRNSCRYLAGSATDVWGTMPGISLHSELELLHKIGLSNREALAAATTNFSTAFGWNTGKIAKGFQADFLLLDKNPCENLNNLNSINRLFNNGKEIPLQSLLQLPLNNKLPNGKIIFEKEFPAFSDSAVKKMVFEKASQNFKPEYDFLKNISMKEVYYMSDGLRVKAYMAYPKNAKNLPVIIYNRGGNREFSKIYPYRVVDILARMASWGYVAIGTQYRGCDGGDGQEEFGGADVNDVLNLFPLLENIPQANADKIGMLGKSRGGMMTYLCLMKTDQIKAAVVMGGLADLQLMNDSRGGEMEKYVYQQLIPHYDQDKSNLLKNRSALTRIDEMTKNTPIFLLHGTADWRVPPYESLEMATGFQKAKIPYRLLMMEGADHGMTEYKSEVNKQIRKWFNRFLIQNEKLPILKPHGK